MKIENKKVTDVFFEQELSAEGKEKKFAELFSNAVQNPHWGEIIEAKREGLVQFSRVAKELFCIASVAYNLRREGVCTPSLVDDDVKKFLSMVEVYRDHLEINKSR